MLHYDHRWVRNFQMNLKDKNGIRYFELAFFDATASHSRWKRNHGFYWALLSCDKRFLCVLVDIGIRRMLCAQFLSNLLLLDPRPFYFCSSDFSAGNETDNCEHCTILFQFSCKLVQVTKMVLQDSSSLWAITGCKCGQRTQHSATASNDSNGVTLPW